MDRQRSQNPGPGRARVTRRRAAVSDPSTIASAVAKAWHGSYSGSAREVPLSVVAALSLLRPGPSLDYDGLEQAVLDLPCGTPFVEFLRDIWKDFIRLRPDLVPRVYPLISWVFKEVSESDTVGAHAVAMAAVRAGQLHLPGPDGRYEIDLFGHVWQELSSIAARSSTGQFFTPPDVAAALTAILMSDQIDADHSFSEPCVGTGGMLLEAAGVIRAAGHDPSSMHWEVVDLDPLVVALCAINMHLWNLGFDLLLGVGDCLTDSWRQQAVGERREASAAAATARETRVLRSKLAALRIAAFDGPTLHTGPHDHSEAEPSPANPATGDTQERTE